MRAKILRLDAKHSREVRNLLQEMALYPESVLNRPNGTGWSAIQTMHHLILVEENSLAYIKKKMSFNPELERVGPGVHFRSFLLWAGLYLPVKFKAPKTVGDEYLPAQSSLEEVQVRWQAVRNTWLEFLNTMPEAWTDKMIYRHPRAGRLGWLQMMGFFGQHLQRHRGQIKRAISAASKTNP